MPLAKGWISIHFSKYTSQGDGGPQEHFKRISLFRKLLGKIQRKIYRFKQIISYGLTREPI